MEALHLATLLCQYGYFFPVGDAKTLHVKDDSSLYRFQVSHFSSFAINLKSQASLHLNMSWISGRLACEQGMYYNSITKSFPGIVIGQLVTWLSA